VEVCFSCKKLNLDICSCIPIEFFQKMNQNKTLRRLLPAGCISKVPVAGKIFGV
jgi:hypothetical protein